MKSASKVIPPRRSKTKCREEFSRSKLNMSLDYIFGKGTSKALSNTKLEFQYSRRTGRIKHVLSTQTKELCFSLRPNGSIAPSVEGFKLLLSRHHNLSTIARRPRWVVTVLDGVTDIVSSGKTVFCKHVVYCAENLRAGEDVVILNESAKVLASGRTVIAGPLIKQFKRGVAVKTREGSEQKHATDES